MAEVTIEQAMAIALAHHQAGRLDQAEPIYRQVLARVPNQVDALHLLGMIALQCGKHDHAIDLIGRAIAISSTVPDFHNNFGMALLGKGDHAAAVTAFRKALALRAEYPQAHNNLGVAIGAMGQQPVAIESYRTAVRLKPDYVEAHRNLADALNSQGRFAEAVDSYRAALSIVPDDARTLNDLANALRQLGRQDEAEATYRRAIAKAPDFAVPYNNLANLLKDKGHLEEAIDLYRKAIQISPQLAPLYNNLGNALAETGALDDAIASYRRVLELTPDDAALHGSLLLTLHYHPDIDGKTALAEHRAWNRQHGEPLRKLIQPHTNNRDPQRKLRIGYVSADLRDHPVGRFLMPLLQHHDRTKFESYCYSGAPVEDAITAQIRAVADHWQATMTLSDQQLAEQIRKDQIDILVDLAAHTAGSRMRVFGMKPAPVQVSYLAYVGTTGLDAIDYRLTDPYLDPPGLNDAFYTEQSVRLPETYWCYQPAGAAPEPGPLPALASGHVTFGSMNNFAKVTDRMLDIWAQLLNTVPNARLLIHAKAGSHRTRVENRLAADGIDTNRLGFINRLPIEQYFSQFLRFDVGLDTYPYGGGTTTCDALWMGVPVVSRFGQRAVSRAGLSILSNAGLSDLVVETDEQYVQVAAALAADLPRLTDLHSTLRDRMRSSPLMNAPRFASNVEQAFRTMWRTWCERAENQTAST